MTAHSEHLLKKEIVWNLQHRSALFAQCREHQISVGNLSLQILGQNFDGLPKLKRSSHLSVFHDGGKSTEIPVESQSRRSGDRMSAPAASWCDPAGESPVQVRSSVRLVASVARPLATVVAKRTQRLHGVWD